jgi:hypothetical protein
MSLERRKRLRRLKNVLSLDSVWKKDGSRLDRFHVIICIIAMQIILYVFRYMAALEDAMNITVCGLFLLLLSQICFDAFSAVTVQYSVIHEIMLTTRTCIDWQQLRISPK